MASKEKKNYHCSLQGIKDFNQNIFLYSCKSYPFITHPPQKNTDTHTHSEELITPQSAITERAHSPIALIDWEKKIHPVLCVYIHIDRCILSLVSSLPLHSCPLPFSPSPLPKNPTLSLTNLHTIWLQWLHSAWLVTCNFGITAKPTKVDSSNLLLKTEIYKHVIAKK